MQVVEYQEDVEALLQAVDPHNNKQMTYSEIVQLLSSVSYSKFNLFFSKWLLPASIIPSRFLS